MNNPTALLMVRPTTFGFNEQTAHTNVFQHRPDTDPDSLRDLALAEFNAYVETLRNHDIPVVIFEDSPKPAKPDAVFPNNWLTTWPDGRVVLYPMAMPNRRTERSPVLLKQLQKQFQVTNIVDISKPELHGQYLESTGAIVFDHQNKIAYGCISSRCNEQLFTDHVQQMDYRAIPFHAYDEQGSAIYHTNIMMGIQSSTAVICLDLITDTTEQQFVSDTLTQSGHTIIDITPEQMTEFCANVLEVKNTAGQPFLLLSQSAYDAFTPEQRAILSKGKQLLPVDLPTIQKVGGGSARCMVAEIFLPLI